MKEISDSFHMKQLISGATRVTKTSRTLIDHIYTTCPDKICKSGVMHTGMSDHCFVYDIMGKESSLPLQTHKYSYNRNYKHFDDVLFKADMNKVNWCEITRHNNIDDAVNDFESKFLEVADRHAPMRRKRVRHKISPWLTDEIVKAMRERDMMKKRASKINSDQLWMEYCMIKTAKKKLSQ